MISKEQRVAEALMDAIPLEIKRYGETVCASFICPSCASPGYYQTWAVFWEVGKAGTVKCHRCRHIYKVIDSRGVI